MDRKTLRGAGHRGVPLWAPLLLALAVLPSPIAVARFDGPRAEHAVTVLHGRASFYGNGFAGRRTASGERYDATALTAAHRTLPLGSLVRVVALSTQRTVVVRINDRGPYVRGRAIDLSRCAAQLLGIVQDGVADVRIEVLSLAS